MDIQTGVSLFRTFLVQNFKFLIGCILFNINLLNTKLRNLLESGVLFLLRGLCMLIDSPIIHGLLLSTP